MPFTTEALQELLDLFFLNSAAPNWGDASGLQPSATTGVFYISLHTASPGLGGSQNTNETSYGGYTRISVARTSAGWVRTGGTIDPVSAINFPACTSGSATITHAGVGSASSGAGHLKMYGTITPNISVAVGIAPQVTNLSSVVLT